MFCFHGAKRLITVFTRPYPKPVELNPYIHTKVPLSSKTNSLKNSNPLIIHDHLHFLDDLKRKKLKRNKAKETNTEKKENEEVRDKEIYENDSITSERCIVE